MNTHFSLLIFTFLSLFSCFSANAQKFAALPADGAVSSGTLPDGLQYSIVSSSTEKGRSEYAILQRACQSDSKALYRLKRIASFSSVKGGESQDSILYKMVLEARASIEECDSLYGTDNQTFLIVGDVDKNSIAEKLRLFSFMVPPSASKAAWSFPYEWKSRPIEAQVYPEEGMGVAKVKVSFFIPRPAPENLNTIVPTVSEIMLETIGEMTRRRLEDTFSTLDLPVAFLAVNHTPIYLTEGDEALNIEFAVGEDNLEQALAIVSTVVTEIGNGEIRKAEMLQAKDAVLQRQKSLARKPLSNEEWLSRIVSGKITGTDLATPATKIKLFTEKTISDSMFVVSIAAMAIAAYGLDENIRISVSGGGMTPAAIEDTFVHSRHRKHDKLHNGYLSLSGAVLPEPSAKPVKPKKTVSDKVFGGTEYQFESGLRVLYKQMPTAGRLYWSAAICGGASSLEGALAGESAYLSDIFGICRINGLKATDFLRLMESKGMTARADVRLDDFILRGEADSKDPALFFRFLLSVLNGRTPDERAFEYYEKCGSLGSRIYAGKHIMDRLESELKPGYAYSQYKTGDILADDFYERAEKYYEKYFGRINDGALIVIGDLTESQFLSVLKQYADQFRTNAAKRNMPSVSFRLLSGERTLPTDYDFTTTRVAASGMLETTLENMHAADIADRVLSRVLESALKDSGWKTKSRISFVSLPKGHVVMRVSARLDPAKDPGAAISAADVRKTIMRELGSLSEGRFQPGEPGYSKTEASTALSVRMASPEYWLWTAEEKVSHAKDYNTGSAAKLSGLTNDRIRNVFSALYNGGRIIF